METSFDYDREIMAECRIENGKLVVLHSHQVVLLVHLICNGSNFPIFKICITQSKDSDYSPTGTT